MLGGADNPNGELPSYITGADNYGDTLPLCSSEATSSPESAKEQPGSPIPHIRPTSRYTAAQELQASLLATLCATLATLIPAALLL